MPKSWNFIATLLAASLMAAPAAYAANGNAPPRVAAIVYPPPFWPPNPCLELCMKAFIAVPERAADASPALMVAEPEVDSEAEQSQ